MLLRELTCGVRDRNHVFFPLVFVLLLPIDPDTHSGSLGFETHPPAPWNPASVSIQKEFRRTILEFIYSRLTENCIRNIVMPFHRDFYDITT